MRNAPDLTRSIDLTATLGELAATIAGRPDQFPLNPCAPLLEITYRSFRNTDPPRILRLWNRCELGRGAARPLTSDAFEVANYAQPYFDPQGLIVAEQDGEVVGFVHAGFGFSADMQRLDLSVGVICVVMVQPDLRRQGIGRELVHCAEEYLRQRGVKEIVAGQSKGRDPFYFTLYGGSRPCGFLESDPLRVRFFWRSVMFRNRHLASTRVIWQRRKIRSACD